MTVPLDAEDVRYRLPMPAPGSPVVLPKWIDPDNRHPNSCYQDPAWSLAPLINNPSTSLRKIYWQRCPESLRGQLKLIAWSMLNGQLRPTYLKSRGTRAAPRTSATEMGTTCSEWVRLACWLHKRGVTDLAACTEEHWRSYIAERWIAGCSRTGAEKVLGRLTALWAFDDLCAYPAGIVRPPWETEGPEDFLPASEGASGGENSTEPLDPQVIGPLLVWAIWMVDEFADDILASWAEKQRLTALAASTMPTQAGKAALETYLLPIVQSDARVPAITHLGEVMFARTFIAAATGASLRQVEFFSERHRLADLVTERPGPCPLQVPVTGRIDERPWREYMDFNEAATLMRHLGTAAMIIVLYLTGMRPQEVQGLRSGCCPEPDAGETGGPYLIRGHHYKNVIDSDGRHISAGEERAVPWVAITPVVRAIRVLERIVPEGELLFSAAHHDFSRQRRISGALKRSALGNRIEGFIAWANREAQTHDLPDQVIPKDPNGVIALARFRRTLAWHVARRPGGLVALAIQYGHMRTVLDARVSGRYGTRSHRGIHSALDVETALAAADTAARLRDRIAAGEKISGPAARRAVTAAAQAPRFEGRIVPATFAKKAAAYLARDGIVLFDNPDASLICAFKRETALCEPAPDATAPVQYDCRPGCGNAIRTDSHARLLRERAAEIDTLAANAPEPVARRLRDNADRLRATADAHDATAQPSGALT
ncbi:integrase [Streptomyces sp. NPDC048663]|uniref:integrase n=1 Tax=Streptomyces sp. NPDC048663 TaxID=3155638 RepID=UPI00344706FF